MAPQPQNTEFDRSHSDEPQFYDDMGSEFEGEENRFKDVTDDDEVPDITLDPTTNIKFKTQMRRLATGAQEQWEKTGLRSGKQKV